MRRKPETAAEAELQADLLRQAETIAGMNVRAGWRYSSLQAFVLDQGGFWRPSGKVRKTGKARECLKNAYELASWGEGLYYVEGFASWATHVLPVHHAWAVSQTGEVYDPTWDTEGIAYMGVPFDLDFVTRTLVKSSFYGVLDKPELRFPLLRRGFPASAKTPLHRPIF